MLRQRRATRDNEALGRTEGAASRWVELTVGLRCNNRCVFCPNGEVRHLCQDPDTSALKRILERARAGAAGVVLAGGEPSVRTDLLELVQHASALGYPAIWLRTNGRRLGYAPFVRELSASGLSGAEVALHATRPSLHDALTRSRDAHGQVLRGVRKAREHGLRLATTTRVVRDNLRDLPPLVDRLVDLDVERARLTFVPPVGTAWRHFGLVVPRYREALPHLRLALDHARAQGLDVRTEGIPYCLLEGYEDRILDRDDEGTGAPRTRGTAPPRPHHRTPRTQGPPCGRCSFAGLCPGPWAGYVRVHGWDELHPRSDAPTVPAAL